MKQLLIDNILKQQTMEDEAVEEASIYIYVQSQGDEKYTGEVVYPCPEDCPCVGLAPKPSDCEGCISDLEEALIG